LIRQTEYVCVFLVGGAVYNLIEVLFRGYTHWSMTIAGGVCFLVIHLLNHGIRRKGIFLRCLIGSAVITSVEFTVGVVVNLVLDLNVWDYSNMYGNILGQICPLFSLAWFLITCPACILSNLIRRFFDSIEQQEKIPT